MWVSMITFTKEVVHRMIVNAAFKNPSPVKSQKQLTGYVRESLIRAPAVFKVCLKRFVMSMIQMV